MGARGRVGEIVDVVIGIQNYSNYFCATETKEYAEVVSRMLFDFGLLDVRGKVRRLPVVVLKECQDILELSSRNKHHALPIVNHATWHVGKFTGGSDPVS